MNAKERLVAFVRLARLYSLFDLVMLLVAAKTPPLPLIGAAYMHVGFLGFLEWRHKQEGRAVPVDLLMWAGMTAAGAQLYGEHRETAWYILFSITYAWKNEGYWGLASPFFRGAQTYCLVSAFAPTSFALFAAAAMLIRNVLGDFRDIAADRLDEMKTWPVLLGIKEGWLFLHLLSVVATTWLWWVFTVVSAVWPTTLTVNTLATYYLTPRSSNDRAIAKLQNYARRLHLI